MAAINSDGVYGASYSELTIDTAQVTVTKQFHTIAAASGIESHILTRSR